MDNRPEMKEIFRNTILQLAKRGTCDRARVGCILTKDDRIIATGYNGSLPGDEHCDDDGHLMVDGHCVRTTHAEQNTLMFCAKNGIDTNGTIMYITHSPCPICTKLLYMAGVKRVYYITPYRIDENPFRIFIRMEELK